MGPRKLILRLLLPLLLLSVDVVTAHNLGAHGLQGGDPASPVPVFPIIGGAYEFKVRVRLDNASASSQCIFEFHNGFSGDLIYFGQDQSTGVRLVVRHGTGVYNVVNAVSANAFQVGVEHEFRVGANSTHSWIYRDGLQLNKIPLVGSLPAAVNRPSALMGDSTHPAFNRLEGAILGVQVRSEASPSMHDSLRNWNLPGQALGPFTISFYAKFQKLLEHPIQPVVEWFNTDVNDNIIQNLLISTASSNRMFFTISYGHSAFAAYSLFDSVIEDEWALWHCSITATGDMIIEKHGEQLSNVKPSARGLNAVPTNLLRRYAVVGRQERNNQNLHGAVLGLRLDLHSAS